MFMMHLNHNKDWRILLVFIIILYQSYYVFCCNRGGGEPKKKGPRCKGDIRMKRTALDAPPRTWGTFRNARYKSYQYGFPPGSSLITLLSDDPGRFGNGHAYTNIMWAQGRDCAKKDFKHGKACFWNEIVGLNRQGRNPSFCPSPKRIKWHLLNTDGRSIMYIWIWCTITKGQDSICPDPCKRDPCKDLSNTVTDVCKTVNEGRFRTDFQCSCAETYQWDQKSQQCRRFDICRNPSTNPCVPTNTQLCQLTKVGFKCQCKQDYMGVRCEKPRDACLENYNKEKLKGMTACGAHGKCKPYLGSNVYTCKCDKGYTDNPDNDYPDCGLKKEACKQIICLNGHCRADQANTKAKCVCNKGWAGDDCGTETPFWNAWGPWGTCQPKCGNPRNRQRTRTCSMKSKECKGDPNDFQNCSPKRCLAEGEWLEWGLWSRCTEECGGGEKMRTRRCFYDTPYGPEGRGSPCKGDALAVKACNENPCPYPRPPRPVGAPVAGPNKLMGALGGATAVGWLPWGTWSACSEQCGPGKSRRVRKCTLGFGRCQGMNFEVRPCQVKCPVGKGPWDGWTSWSACPPGTKVCSRTRNCPMGPGKCIGSGQEQARCVNNLCDGSDGTSLDSVIRNTGMGGAQSFVEVQNTHGVNGGAYEQSLQQGKLQGHTDTAFEMYTKSRPTPIGHIIGAVAGVIILLLVLLFVFRKQLSPYIKKIPVLNKLLVKKQLQYTKAAGKAKKMAKGGASDDTESSDSSSEGGTTGSSSSTTDSDYGSDKISKDSSKSSNDVSVNISNEIAASRPSRPSPHRAGGRGLSRNSLLGVTTGERMPPPPPHPTIRGLYTRRPRPRGPRMRGMRPRGGAMQDPRAPGLAPPVPQAPPNQHSPNFMPDQYSIVPESLDVNSYF